MRVNLQIHSFDSPISLSVQARQNTLWSVEFNLQDTKCTVKSFISFKLAVHGQLLKFNVNSRFLLQFFVSMIFTYDLFCSIKQLQHILMKLKSSYLACISTISPNKDVHHSTFTKETTKFCLTFLWPKPLDVLMNIYAWN